VPQRNSVIESYNFMNKLKCEIGQIENDKKLVLTELKRAKLRLEEAYEPFAIGSGFGDPDCTLRV
jgi:hypothetical protein